MRKISVLLVAIMIVYGVTFTGTANAITAPKTIQAFEEPYFISNNSSEWLAQNKLITYKQKSYIHIRDAAQFLGLHVGVDSGDIYLTSDASITPTNVVDHLPKEPIVVWDGYQIRPNVSAQAAIVIEDGKIYQSIYSKNANQTLYPSSTTKIMTALLALENGNLNDVVTVGYSAMNIPSDSSKAGIWPGDKMTLEQLLYAMLLPSGNDAASAIAEYIGGSEWQFVNMMNARAKALGAYNTSFTNPHGYHHDNLYTTALDLGIIATEAAKHPAFMNIIGTPVYSTSYINNGKTINKTWKNTNELIKSNSPYYIPTVQGGKTGYTSKSRHNLVSFAQNGDYQYITVILRGEKYQRYIDTKNLLNEAYAKRSQMDRSKTSMYVVPFNNRIFVNGHQIPLNGDAFTKNYSTYISVQLLKELAQNSPNVTLSDQQEIKASLDGELLTFGQSKPIIQNDRMLVPARTFFENIGLELKWYPETQKVEIFSEDILIELFLNQKSAWVNGQEVILDAAPISQYDRTLVPLRFISETAGVEVDWGRGRTIYIH